MLLLPILLSYIFISQEQHCVDNYAGWVFCGNRRETNRQLCHCHHDIGHKLFQHGPYLQQCSRKFLQKVKPFVTWKENWSLNEQIQFILIIQDNIFANSCQNNYLKLSLVIHLCWPSKSTQGETPNLVVEVLSIEQWALQSVVKSKMQWYQIL